MNTLLIDLGNTRLKLARWQPPPADTLHMPMALAHADPDFDEELDALLQQHDGASQALLASVAGAPLTGRVTARLAQRGVQVSQVAVDPKRDDLRICYADPARFGVDRWLGLLGARQRAGTGRVLLVVSCGTALTIDLVDAAGQHLGGAIAASPALMVDALRTRAPHLPALRHMAAGEPAANGAATPAAAAGNDAFACDTTGALDSGCHGAALGLLARCVQQARQRTGSPPQLLLTGGGAPALLARMLEGGDAELRPSYHAWLVLDGLALLARERS